MKGLRRSGFTMIELVIVIVIMGVMAFTAYKALMASSDKNKAGTLIKSEFGEIRQNCTDVLESSRHHTFSEIGDESFHKLFPKAYNIVPADSDANTSILVLDSDFNQSEGSADLIAYQASLLDSNSSTFMSDIVPECVWTITDSTTFGTPTSAPDTTYSVNLECTDLADEVMKKLIESKAKKYVLKEFDTYGIIPQPDNDGNITFSGLVR